MNGNRSKEIKCTKGFGFRRMNCILLNGELHEKLEFLKI